MTSKDIEYEIKTLYTENLYNIIRKRIRGTINIVVENNILKIVVFDIYNTKFVYCMNNFFDIIIKFSVPAEQIANDFYKVYVKEITSRYFK